MPERHDIERIVKPRRKPDGWFPIISIDSGQIFIERTGEILPHVELPTRLRSEPPSILVAHNFSYLLAELDAELSHDPRWQYRLTPVKRAIFKAYDPTPKRPKTVTQDTVIAFCGFRPPEGSKKKGHYHFPLDPVLFFKGPIENVIESDVPRLTKLYEWACDVREWCGEHDLKISPTVGGIGGQLLRDPRFYPEARRKVPKATNARARDVLPGNYYKLLADTIPTYRAATYLDMRSAHHHCASIINAPHSDGLFARGRFRVTEETLVTGPTGPPWARLGTPAYQTLMAGHGLFLVRLTVPTLKPTAFPPPIMETPGRKLAFVYSNELPMIRELGGIIDSIEAAWTSHKKDHGLTNLATWAITESALMSAMRKRWAKPALLGAYGVLAARPRAMTFGFRRAKGGTLEWFPAGPHRLPAYVRTTALEHELPVTNVIQRGMIEAQCRMEVLALARYLHGHGLNVLSLYADSIIVESAPLPILPAPWIVKHDLTGLRFFNATSFTSRELTKLPGIPREGFDTIRRLGRIRSVEDLTA